jgi:hypothetical protein
MCTVGTCAFNRGQSQRLQTFNARKTF